MATVQNGNLIASNPSNYVNYISACIDNKMTQNAQITSLGSILCQAPPEENTGVNLSNKEIVFYESLLNNIQKLNADTQSIILINTPGFKAWITCNMYCKDEAVQQYAKLRLEKLGLSYFFDNPKERLLRHVFKELTLNSNRKEVNDLLAQYRAQNELSANAKSQLQIVAEKMTLAVSYVLFFIAIPAACYVGYLVGTNISHLIARAKIEYLPILVNQIINHTPIVMIRKANTIYNWRLTIITTTYLIKNTRLNNYSFIRIPVEILSQAAWLPIKITRELFWLPFTAASHTYSLIHATIRKTSHFMHEGSGFIEALRISHELRKAENLWIDQVMKLKAHPPAA